MEGARLETGAWIGRYQVEALLGTGGMGAVYQVRDSVLDRSVALKAIRLDQGDDGAMRDRFQREARALAQLNHRHICQVYDWLEWGPHAFIAMELVEGRTLREAAPALDTSAKLRILRAIAEALEAAHAKGIVHRDLKPMNVMVDSAERVKVVDFGLARLLEPGQASPEPPRPLPGRPLPAPTVPPESTSIQPLDLDEPTQAEGPSRSPSWTASGPGPDPSLTHAGSFMGSPAYASPEQMERLEVGPPSDIFSLGIVAWELLLGDAPFPGKGQERMMATVEGRRQSLQGRKLSSRLKGLLRRMLDPEPSRRPSARRVAEILGRELRPFPAAKAAAAAAGLALLLGGAYLAFGRGVVADLVKGHPPRLVVLPIRNGTGDATLKPLAEVGMTELMAAALRDSPSLQVVDQETVARALTTLRLDPDHPLTQGQMLQLLQILGAPLVLEGTLERIPSGALRYAFALRAQGGGARHRGETLLAPGLPPAPYTLVEPAARELLRKVDPLGKASAHGTPPPPEAYAAYARGKALFMKGEFQASEPLLREAALKAPAFSQAVTAYASCLRRLGRDHAILVSHWAVMAARTTGDRWAEIRALGVQAFLARDRGDLAEAEHLRRTTLALAMASRDPDGAAVALNHLGLLAGERGQDGAAQAYFEQSLNLARQLSDQTNLTLAQNNLANLALKRGDLEAATARYQEALAGQVRMGNRSGEAMTLNNLGVVALTRGHLAEARYDLERALALREAIGDLAGRATSQRNLGILELMKGNLDPAEANLRKALEAARASAILAIEAECRFCLADLLRLRQHLRAAQEEFGRAAELLKAGVTPRVRAAAQAGAAECEARLRPGTLQEASRRLEALDPEDRRSPYALRAWAWIHWLSGRPAQALEALDQALADPSRSAPEIRGELRALRKRFASPGPGSAT